MLRLRGKERPHPQLDRDASDSDGDCLGRRGSEARERKHSLVEIKRSKQGQNQVKMSGLALFRPWYEVNTRFLGKNFFFLPYFFPKKIHATLF